MENHQKEGWDQLNNILIIAVGTANDYPDKTNFLKELDNCLPSLVGRGSIKKDVMRKVCDELKKCRKAMGEVIPDLKDLI